MDAQCWNWYWFSKMDDARHHHAPPSATRNCTRYPWLPCAPQPHCYSATATPNPNTAYTAICHCLSLEHYRPPCGIGKTGLAINLRLPEHQGSIPSIPWKIRYHSHHLLQPASHFMCWLHFTLSTGMTAWDIEWRGKEMQHCMSSYVSRKLLVSPISHHQGCPQKIINIHSQECLLSDN
jgi:hypothetical protein